MIQCTFCRATVTDIETAIDTGWIPVCFISLREIDRPVCPACQRAHCFEIDDVLVLRGTENSTGADDPAPVGSPEGHEEFRVQLRDDLARDRYLRRADSVLDLLLRLATFPDRHPETVSLPVGMAADMLEMAGEAGRLLKEIEGE